MDNVHAFDGSIDIEHFHDALASTLQMYPHAAGKLCTTGGRWFVSITESRMAGRDSKTSDPADKFRTGC